MSNDAIKLTVELIPRHAYLNLRNSLSKVAWDCIRRTCYKKYDYSCAVCGDHGETPPEAHEVWSFNVELKIQTLVELRCLCRSCHEATHLGLATIKGHFNRASNRIARLNGWSHVETENYINKVVKCWHKQSEVKMWRLDLTYLLHYCDLYGDVYDEVLRMCKPFEQRGK